LIGLASTTGCNGPLGMRLFLQRTGVRLLTPNGRHNGSRCKVSTWDCIGARASILTRTFIEPSKCQQEGTSSKTPLHPTCWKRSHRAFRETFSPCFHHDSRDRMDCARESDRGQEPKARIANERIHESLDGEGFEHQRTYKEEARKQHLRSA
jgi:hypothetical protein